MKKEKLQLRATYTRHCEGVSHQYRAWCAHDSDGHCWGRLPTRKELVAYIRMTNTLVKRGEWAERPWLVIR